MIKCIKCDRTLEEVQKQDGAFELYSDRPFICNNCRKRQENEDFWNSMKKLFDVERKDKQIADLQHRLEVAEKALNKMSVYAIGNYELYDLINDFNIENGRFDEDHFCINTCDVVDYFKEQSEMELRGKNE